MIVRSFSLYSTYHTYRAIPVPIEIDEYVLNYRLDKWLLSDKCTVSSRCQHDNTDEPGGQLTEHISHAFSVCFVLYEN